MLKVNNFTGADWGGKFVDISKKSWINSYLSLADDNPIVSAFQLLVEWVLTKQDLVDAKLLKEIQPVERFVCSVYSSGSPPTFTNLAMGTAQVQKSEELETTSHQSSSDATYLMC